MKMANDNISLIQDAQSLKSALLIIDEALSTGKYPKSFLIYNDDWIDEMMRNIAYLMKTKYNIDVPSTEL